MEPDLRVHAVCVACAEHQPRQVSTGVDDAFHQEHTYAVRAMVLANDVANNGGSVEEAQLAVENAVSALDRAAKAIGLEEDANG